MIERVLGFATLMGAGLLLAYCALAWYTYRLLTRPPRRTYAWALSRSMPGDPSELSPSLEFRSFTFRGRTLELPAWELPGEDPGGDVFIISGGWGDSRVTMLQRARVLRRFASKVVMWDPPGHGDAPGSTSLGAHEAEDLLALCAMYEQEPLVLYGFSLGGGISIEAAARGVRPNIRGVIAEAPYRLPVTPVRNAMIARGVPHRTNLPVAMMLAGLKVGVGLDFGISALFDRAGHAGNVAVPLLVLHGDKDAVTPVEDSREIATAAPRGRLVVVAGAEHTTMWTQHVTGSLALEAVAGFCREISEARTIRHA